MEYFKPTKTIDLTISSLCAKIDSLKEEVKFWQEKYEEERKENDKIMNESLESAKKGVADALFFALSTKEDGNGNLIIDKESRQSLIKRYDNGK